MSSKISTYLKMQINTQDPKHLRIEGSGPIITYSQAGFDLRQQTHGVSRPGASKLQAQTPRPAGQCTDDGKNTKSTQKLQNQKTKQKIKNTKTSQKLQNQKILQKIKNKKTYKNKQSQSIVSGLSSILLPRRMLVALLVALCFSGAQGDVHENHTHLRTYRLRLRKSDWKNWSERAANIYKVDIYKTQHRGELYLSIDQLGLNRFNNFKFSFGKYDAASGRQKMIFAKPPKGLKRSRFNPADRWMYVESDHEYDFLEWCKTYKDKNDTGIPGAAEAFKQLEYSYLNTADNGLVVKDFLSQRLRIQVRKAHNNVNLRSMLGFASTKFAAVDVTVDVLSNFNAENKKDVFRLYHTDEKLSLIGFDDFTIDEVLNVKDLSKDSELNSFQRDSHVVRLCTSSVMGTAACSTKVKDRWLYIENESNTKAFNQRQDEITFLKICANKKINKIRIGQSTIELINKNDDTPCCENPELDIGDANHQKPKCKKCKSGYRSGKWKHEFPAMAVHRFECSMKKERIVSGMSWKETYKLDVFMASAKKIDYIRLWHNGIIKSGHFGYDNFVVNGIYGEKTDIHDQKYVRLQTRKHSFMKDLWDMTDRMLYEPTGTGKDFLDFLIEYSETESFTNEYSRRRRLPSTVDRLVAGEDHRETSSPIALDD